MSVEIEGRRIGDDSPEAVLAAVARLRDITADVLARAASAGTTPLEIADRIVLDRLARRRRARGSAG